MQRLTKVHPVHITGTVKHAQLWLTSNSTDDVYFLDEKPSPFVPKEAAKNRIAIYCIHGTADKIGAFRPLANSLKTRQKLPESIRAINVVKLNCQKNEPDDIESFAKQLLKNIQSRNDKNIILIGHSRGGLIAAYFAEYLAKNAGINVHAVIGICTPFQGSLSANRLFGYFAKSIGQMSPNSQFLRELAEKTNQSRLKYLCLSATNDLLVTKESAHLRNARCEELVDNSHLSIMSSQKLVDVVEGFISTTISKNSTSIKIEVLASSVQDSKELNYLTELDTQINTFAAEIKVNNEYRSQFMSALRALHQDLTDDTNIIIAKETIHLLRRLQQWDSKIYLEEAIRHYKNGCELSSPSGKCLKAIAAVIITGIGFILGAAAATAIATLIGVPTAGAAIAGGLVIGFAFGMASKHFLFQPSKIEKDTLEVAQAASNLASSMGLINQ